jgi:hypothetical protein
MYGKHYLMQQIFMISKGIIGLPNKISSICNKNWLGNNQKHNGAPCCPNVEKMSSTTFSLTGHEPITNVFVSI